MTELFINKPLKTGVKSRNEKKKRKQKQKHKKKPMVKGHQGKFWP